MNWRGSIEVLAADRERRDVDAAEVFGRPSRERAVAAERLFAHPGRLRVPPGVPVQMKAQLADAVVRLMLRQVSVPVAGI